MALNDCDCSLWNYRMDMLDGGNNRRYLIGAFDVLRNGGTAHIRARHADHLWCRSRGLDAQHIARGHVDAMWWLMCGGDDA